MILHPFQQLSLVFQAIVEAQGFVVRNLLASEEAIRPDSIIEIDHDKLAVGGTNQIGAIVVEIPVDAETAALDENIDR